MNKNDYAITPDAYLGRAREHILNGSAQSLFYAALELRFFVESKQDQYLEAQAEYAKSVPKRWKIGAQGKALEAIFESNRIQQVAWSVKGELIYEAHYVPLPPELRKYAERLGDLLHAMGEWKASDDPWWSKTWKDLRVAYELAWQCNRGLLLSPMFLVEGHAVGTMVLSADGDARDKLLKNMEAGTMGVMKVDYLNAPPSAWQSDLYE